MLIINSDGNGEEWSDDDPRVRAYHALYTAAERMAQADYESQLAAHVKRGRKKSTFKQYTPSESTNRVADALPHILDGTLTPNDAMAMLHEYDVLKLRLSVPARP